MKTATFFCTALAVACSGIATASPFPGGPGGNGGYGGGGYGGGGYSNSPGGWGNNGYPGNNGRNNKPIFYFTSTYNIVATPDQVVNGTGAASKPAPGQPGAVGYYNIGLNTDSNTICFNITLLGVTGPYQSPAKTATHLHQAPKGQGGPPRIAFPNPVGDDNKRVSYGCIQGPFTTGIISNGVDTGANFNVAQIEADPASFFVDVHTTKYVPGAVRGQIA